MYIRLTLCPFCASLQVKDLMIDWHLGEQYFMQQFMVSRTLVLAMFSL